MENCRKHSRVRQWGPVPVLILASLVFWVWPSHAYYICIQPDGSQLITDTPGPNCVNQDNPASSGVPSRENPKESQEKRKPATPATVEDAAGEFMDLVRQGDAETVRTLLAAGMDPNVRDNNSTRAPALSWAAGFGNVEVMLALLEYGGVVDIFNKSGATALMTGAFQGQTDAVRLLLERGAYVNAKDTEGKTPLMYAVAGGGPAANDIVDLLIKHGASINAVNDDGGTPLIVAAANGYSSLVRKLISHGADPDLKDKLGKSALMWAMERSDQSSILALEGAGAFKKPAEPVDFHGNNKEWWQARLRDLQQQKNDILFQISDAEKRLNLIPPDLPAKTRRRMWVSIKEELSALQVFLQMYDQAIEIDLPEEARKAGAPPGWVRE